METYDLVDALQAHQGQRHFKFSRQTSETLEIRRKRYYGIFRYFSITFTFANGMRLGGMTTFFEKLLAVLPYRASMEDLLARRR